MLFAPPQLPRTLPAALRDAADKSPDVRRSALRDLSRHHQEGDEEIRAQVETALFEALEDESPPVRGEAAEQLGLCRVSAALPALLTAIEDPHVVVRQMAIAALGDIGDTRALGRLERALSDDRPELRYQATMALPRIAPADAEPYFLTSLNDGDADVRHIALRVAEETYLSRDVPAEDRPPLPPSVQARARELVTDSACSVRLAAALLLAAANDRTGEKVLLEVVTQAPEDVEADDEGAAVEAMGTLAVREAIPALRSRAFGVGRFLRERFSFLALVSLARLGDAQAEAKILGDLDAWSREKRNLAIIAAGRGNVRSALPQLKTLRAKATPEDVGVIDDALALLDPRS